MVAVDQYVGGINTNIVRNARWRKDPQGRGRSHEQMVQEFAALTLTQPNKAAEIIHRGVEAGKARILVGPDAYRSIPSADWRRRATTTWSAGSRQGCGDAPGRMSYRR